MKTLRTRLIVNTLIPLLVIIPVTGILITYLLETQVFLGNITSELTRQAVLVADTASAYIEIWQDPIRAQAFVTRISPRVTAKVMLLDPEGRLIVSSDPEDSFLIGQVFNVPDVEILSTSELQAEITMEQRKITDIIVPVYSSRDVSLIGFVRLVNPLASIYERSQTLRQVMVFVLAGGLLLGLVLSWLLARDLERPIRETTDAAYRLASGRNPQPLTEEGLEETRVLQRAFNTMVERLQTLESSRKRLLGNLVHELGRPLGALRSASQALLSGAGEDPQLRHELVQGMDDELVRLQGLLNELAHLHEQVLGSLDLEIKNVKIQPWLESLLPTWLRLAQDKHLKWETTFDPSTPEEAFFDPDRMAQVMENLFSNALRYTPPGGHITLTMCGKSEGWQVNLGDDGPGIDGEEAERIFEPYQRGKAAQRLPEGMGLGLSIARDLVQAHHGSLTFTSQPGKGSRFIVWLPMDTQKYHPEELNID
ncbi:MAG TPA: HAMP domain-containing sensor histidine kinase [Anaerolineaceae bacterium]|nr:HAMP domain-containing sensor histidine kinase [Anaerolineaceae bacterium]